MNVIVTGAGGFLGRSIVDHLVRSGHEVTAVVRPGGAAVPFPAGVSVVRGDLRDRGDWRSGLPSQAIVVHAAAAAGGDRGFQLSNTVVATERFLETLTGLDVRRLVHISSFSVYDYAGLEVGQELDESSPLEPAPRSRDAYTEAKLLQERLVRSWCEAIGLDALVLRPGAIVGPGKVWGCGVAFSVAGAAFVVAPGAAFPMISVANCAEAVAKAAECSLTGIQTVNLVDDDLPTRRSYFRACHDATGTRAPRLVPVPWRALHTVGRALQSTSDRFLDGRLRVPELLDAPRQAPRWKPLV